MEELKEEVKKTNAKMEYEAKTFIEKHVQATQEEPKKRGRKSYENMSEEEKNEYDKKKKEKEEEKAELERLKSLGVNPSDLKDNNMTIILTDDFIKKCKKEKVSQEQYVDILYVLMNAYVNDKLKIKGEAIVKYSLED